MAVGYAVSQQLQVIHLLDRTYRLEYTIVLFMNSNPTENLVVVLQLQPPHPTKFPKYNIDLGLLGLIHLLFVQGCYCYIRVGVFWDQNCPPITVPLVSDFISEVSMSAEHYQILCVYYIHTLPGQFIDTFCSQNPSESCSLNGSVENVIKKEVATVNDYVLHPNSTTVYRDICSVLTCLNPALSSKYVDYQICIFRQHFTSGIQTLPSLSFVAYRMHIQLCDQFFEMPSNEILKVKYPYYTVVPSIGIVYVVSKGD